MTKSVTHRKFFGIYLHALILHAPPQYEILNLKAANTEHEERLFGQAKTIVQNASNRQPNNVIPNILLRLQAKQMKKDLYKSYHESNSRVSKAARELQPATENTHIPFTFLTGRMSSWQEHLKRISPYLVPGPGIWWKKTEEGFEFHDGRNTPDTNTKGPQLKHFRSTSLDQIYTNKESIWNDLIHGGIELPTPYIKLYSEDGKFLGYKRFDCNAHDALEEMDTDVPFQDKNTSIHQRDVDSRTPQRPQDVELASGNEAEDDHITLIVQELEPPTHCIQLQDSELPLHLKTKLASALSKVFGATKAVVDLDKLRHRIKSHTASSQEQCQHAALLQVLKYQLKQTRKTRKQAIKEFERKCHSSTGRLPDSTDMEYKELLQSSKFVSQLLAYQDFSKTK